MRIVNKVYSYVILQILSNSEFTLRFNGTSNTDFKFCGNVDSSISINAKSILSDKKIITGLFLGTTWKVKSYYVI